MSNAMHSATLVAQAATSPAAAPAAAAPAAAAAAPAAQQAAATAGGIAQQAAGFTVHALIARMEDALQAAARTQRVEYASQ